MRQLYRVLIAVCNFFHELQGLVQFIFSIYCRIIRASTIPDKLKCIAEEQQILRIA